MAGESHDSSPNDKAERMKKTLRGKLTLRDGKYVKVQDLQKLLAATLTTLEFEALLAGVTKGRDDTVDLDFFVDFLFNRRRPEAAGSGVSAVRLLHTKSLSSGSPAGSPGSTVAPPPSEDYSPVRTPPQPELGRDSTFPPDIAAELDKQSDYLPKTHSCASVMTVEGKQTEWAIPTRLDRSLLREFLALDQHGKVQADYVWIDSEYTTDGHNFDLCSKSITLDHAPKSVADLPIWSYSGEDEGVAAEVIMVPRKIYRDPFRRGGNIIVLTDTYKPPRKGVDEDHNGPTEWNTRSLCDSIMKRAIHDGEDPWFGLEQEYYLLDAFTNWPLGWPTDGFPGKQGAFFCATGAAKAPGRDVVEAHYRACLYAGVKIGGINSEIAPGQWEFQVGPSPGIHAADDLWMARYLLQRVAEVFMVNVTFMPKPVHDWAGIGGHTNYSTTSTRNPGGWDVIMKHCERLKARHLEHMEAYGSDNELRLVGNDETQSFNRFSYGVGDRSASIRIPVKAAARKCGYYEDRRPAANMDPYLVTRMIVETTLFYDENGNPIPEQSKGKGKVEKGLREDVSKDGHAGDSAAGRAVAA